MPLIIYVAENSRSVDTGKSTISQSSTLTLSHKGSRFYEFEISIGREIYELDEDGYVHESHDHIYQNFPTSLEELEKIYHYIGAMLESQNNSEA